MPAQVNHELKAAGGSDHIEQYMDANVNGRNLRVAIHNMTDKCNPRNNAWKIKEEDDEYTARLQWMSAQYARDFESGTDVLMLQEAPNTVVKAEELFNYIAQANPGIPLNYKYSTNGRGQGMMTVYNVATMGEVPGPIIQPEGEVQSTSFNFHGQLVTMKNVHLSFNAQDNVVDQILLHRPDEIVIEGGDHNGSKLKFKNTPGLTAAHVGTAATSVSASMNEDRFFTGDPKDPNKQNPIGKQYDLFAVAGPNVSITKVQSAGSFSLENNKQAGNNLVYTPNLNLNLDIPAQIIEQKAQAIEPKGIPAAKVARAAPAMSRYADPTAKPNTIVRKNNGLIELQFGTGFSDSRRAERFATGLELDKITNKPYDVGGNENDGYSITIAEKEYEEAARRGYPIPTIANLGKQQQAAQAPGRPLPPQPKNYVVGKTGLIQCQFNTDDEANDFAKALYETRYAGERIAERGQGHDRQKYADLVNGIPTIRLTEDECTKLLDSGLLSQESATMLNVFSGLQAPKGPGLENKEEKENAGAQLMTVQDFVERFINENRDTLLPSTFMGGLQLKEAPQAIKALHDAIKNDTNGAYVTNKEVEAELKAIPAASCGVFKKEG